MPNENLTEQEWLEYIGKSIQNLKKNPDESPFKQTHNPVAVPDVAFGGARIYRLNDHNQVVRFLTDIAQEAAKNAPAPN